ncbi:IMP cyclohydrolase [Anaerotignum neopropionicum]|uniref:IMP cyclohydrolase n=1 Tax=Anaerotignum neopropionicum TaxID=36847 RepID=A0A136WCV8_9FIRM|nr:IMP cyclohydrolase [Anaerotignum neopropionicum]KXL52353.1 IMP cyclohydrolase [Anaerotignum neopropionicum]
MDIYKLNSMKDLVKDNPYVGRGIVIGKTVDGSKAAVAYFIMGRSENSRNRVFIENGEEVIIKPFDESKVEDPSLIIYSPIKKLENKLIVTNGDQTDTIYDYVKAGKTFEESLETREFEPDVPNFTPRISGMLTFSDGDFAYKMSILKSTDAKGSGCNRYTFAYPGFDGLGHFIHTYAGDGNPLPTFQGEPERVAIPEKIDAFVQDIWENLNEENKISLYVRYIDLKTGTIENRMINKNK